MGMKDRDFQQKLLKTQVETNDCVIIAIGNYVDEESPDIEIEFALNADTDELFGMFKELFKNEAVRDEARKAVLQSDYGKNQDSLDNLLN
tara:strand:+ start:7080 stop:7349 length:270 start_codon:yes stop_codon:yes gene_type:complete